MTDFFTRYNRFAVLGLSRKPKSFSRQACEFLKSQGCQIYPVNPHTEKIDGQVCYKSIADTPDPQAAIFFTNPRVTEKLLPVCKEKGIIHVWLQQGSADNDVLKVADNLGIQYENSCVFMHHPKAGFPHNLHRSIVKILGLGK